MHIVTVSRKELKECYQNEKANVALDKENKIDVDLEPLVKLFNKIYTHSTMQSAEI